MMMLDQSVGWIARNVPGSTRLFRGFDLDFCCGGQHSLRDALAQKGIDVEPVLESLKLLQGQPQDEQDWSKVPPAELIDHILHRYHARHREQLPELIYLARRVEQVHGERPECPLGLSDHLASMLQELESHMLKEENILFPILQRGVGGGQLNGPISVMRSEHDEHGQALALMNALTDNLQLPKGACNTWRALYTGLRQLQDDLMQHIHLENNILFDNAQGGGNAAL